MKYSGQALVFLCILLLLSCRNEKEPAREGSETESTDASPEASNDFLAFDREAVINSLEGIWRESDYPFRRAEFKDSLVKFVEEGVVEPPEFREYKIADQCPFEINNIRDLKPEDIILVMPETGTCEKLLVSKDSLILIGFSVTTGKEYQIVYRRVE